MDPSRYSFSLGIEASEAAWLSGQTAGAYDSDTKRIEVRGDAGSQAEVCWQKIDAVLDVAKAGALPCSELVEYLTEGGLAQRDAVAKRRPGNREASVMVVESLLRKDALVEIEVVAGSSPGLLRLPQILPLGADGTVVAPGDLLGQAEFVIEEAGRLLEARGLGLDQVVRTVEQTTAATRREYRKTGKARRRLLGPAFPASTGILSPALPHPEALIALEVWASEHPKEVINPGWSSFDALTFSPGVKAGSLLFVSGSTAWDPNTGENLAPGDIGAQAEFVYETIGRICEAAGGSLENLVKTIEYVSPAGVAGYRDVSDVRRRLLGEPAPASTGVVVEGLLSSSWLIEIEALAVLP